MANLGNLFTLTDYDLNGDLFVLGAEGEVEEELVNNTVLFLPGTPAAPANAPGRPVVFTRDQATEFLVANALHSVNHGRTDEEAARIAYIRYCAARYGLISPHFQAAANNVRYNDAHRMSPAEETAFRADVAGAQAHTAAFVAALPEARRVTMERIFTDMVCCVAFVFRVRGHHYKEDLRARYETLWQNCLHEADELPVSWERIATDALHAIMPNILDTFWRDSATNSRCAGALIKRVSSAPAGCAGLYALQRGLADVMMVFPGIIDRVPDAYADFQEIMGRLGTSRWGGSINARFYNVARVRIDEGKIGALASVVMGIYEQMAPDSKLRDSPALKRLAQIAPATGGAIGLAARRTAQDERMNLLDTTQAYSAPT